MSHEKTIHDGKKESKAFRKLKEKRAEMKAKRKERKANRLEAKKHRKPRRKASVS
jgi:hypothetical protein